MRRWVRARPLPDHRSPCGSGRSGPRSGAPCDAQPRCLCIQPPHVRLPHAQRDGVPFLRWCARSALAPEFCSRRSLPIYPIRYKYHIYSRSLASHAYRSATTATRRSGWGSRRADASRWRRPAQGGADGRAREPARVFRKKMSIKRAVLRAISYEITVSTSHTTKNIVWVTRDGEQMHIPKKQRKKKRRKKR